ncbi:MAG TPA: DMT family transporter [Gemmatimonadaceae bacterium]|nr:DMT family transporter [Gemmatimonadaceae bacterium]
MDASAPAPPLGAAPAATAPRSLARATGMVAFAACCFGSISIFVSIGIAAGATLLTLLAFRYLLGAALLTAAGGGPRSLAIPRAQWVPALLVGGGGQALVAFVSLSALRYIPVATLGFLFYTFPAWVAVIAAVRRTEPLTRLRLIALALSFSGIAVMVGSPWSAPMHPAGVALALGSAMIYALYIPALGRIQRGIRPQVAGAYIAIGASTIFFAVGLATGAITAQLAPAAWVAVLGLALISTMLGFVAFLKGLAVLGPVRTAIVSTVEPFWTAIAGAIVLTQPLTASTIVGGALIAVAVLTLQVERRSAAA